MNLDLTRPLEAVRHSDGKVVPLTLASTDIGGFYTKEVPDGNETNSGWLLNGQDRCYKNLWFARNVSIDPVELAELRAFKEQALRRFPALAEPETDEEAAKRFVGEYYDDNAIQSIEDILNRAITWARANPR